MPFLTPDRKAGFRARLFFIPSSLSPTLSGAVSILAEERVWKEFGEMTVTECAEAFVDCSFDLEIGSIFPSGDKEIANTLPCDGSSRRRRDFEELAAVYPDWVEDGPITEEFYLRLPNLPGHVVIAR